MEEVWMDIQDYEGLYQVSNTGKVKSLHYSGGNNDRILKDSINTDRRHKVSLYKNGKHKQCLVHRLVAQAFIPNPLGLPDINHIDENPENNNVENLEWCTCEYNNETYYKNHPEKYSLKYRTIYRLTRKTNDWRSKKIIQKDKNGKVVKIWDNVAEIKKNGYSDNCVIECCKGIRYAHKGYIWEFEDVNGIEIRRNTRKRRDWSGVKILQKDLTGKPIFVWEDIKDIRTAMKCKGDPIIKCCEGQRKYKTAYGFTWEFAN